MVAELVQVRSALADAMSEIDTSTSGLGDLDRTVDVVVSDHDAVLHGRLAAGRITFQDAAPDKPAAITLRASSDDLMDLAAGELDVMGSWASGRISIKAGFGDLMKLRQLLGGIKKKP